jgi:Tfp pilus assembly protein PilF
MRFHGILIAALLALVAAGQAAAQMPAPVLEFSGAEEQQVKSGAVVVYKLSVRNRSSFAEDLFSSAPDLPPCGANASASRTWVNVHDGDGSSARLYGFCALNSADGLGKLSFSLPKDKTPPRSVYITVTDRRANVTVTSNRVRIPETRLAPAAGTDFWKECQSQQSDQALKACTQIIDAKAEPAPKLAQAYNMRAIVHQRMGQPDKAIADFGEAIQLMTSAGKSGFEMAFIYFMRANTYRGMGNLDQAIADHSESIRVAPSWDKSYNDRGAIYFQKGDFARALDDISKVISFRPDNPRVADSYAIRAMLHQRMGQPANGLPDADRAIELNPRSAMALYVRARILEALGRDQEAAAGMRAALAIDPRIKEQMDAMERAGKP